MKHPRNIHGPRSTEKYFQTNGNIDRLYMSCRLYWKKHHKNNFLMGNLILDEAFVNKNKSITIQEVWAVVMCLYIFKNR
jgi:hypothetical protein